MNTTKMDTDFAHGVRAELSAIGTRNSILQRHRRRTRALTFGVGALALVAATTGAAIVVNNLPGETTFEALSKPVTVTNTGTAKIELGAIPADATGVVLDLTCLSDGGQIVFYTIDKPEAIQSSMGGSVCSKGYTSHFDNVQLPKNGGTSITIAAKPDTKWKATAQYAILTTSDWGTNAAGQTYGIGNVNGTPDLTAMQASNGEWGYVNTREYNRMTSKSVITVYETDGRTPVGSLKSDVVFGNPTGPTETFEFNDFIDDLDR